MPRTSPAPDLAGAVAAALEEIGRHRADRTEPAPQPGRPQPGRPQPGHPQPGHPQPGHPQPGRAEPPPRLRRAEPARQPGWEDALLDAVSEQLAAHGLREWTVEDVATSAGVGRATIYRHFPTRDALVQASVTRDARRFFTAIAAAVDATSRSRPPARRYDADPPGEVAELSPQEPTSIPPGRPGLADLVVDGLLAGLALARRSPLGELIRRDPATATGLLTSATFIATATSALIEVHEDLTGARPVREQNALTRARAEALVRLALTFLLAPGELGALAPRAARRYLAAMVQPLVDFPGDPSSEPTPPTPAPARAPAPNRPPSAQPTPPGIHPAPPAGRPDRPIPVSGTAATGFPSRSANV